MKKIFTFVLSASALILISGVSLAQTAPHPLSGANRTTAPRVAPTSAYTTEQQACLRTAQEKRSAAMKSATDALNSATQDALKTRQDAIKSATDTFNAANKDALKTRQDKMQAAQKIKDVKARMAAMKSANDAYNNNKEVKNARDPYTAAMKSANDAYNNDAGVQQAKDPYTVAMKAANDAYQSDMKACLGNSTSGDLNSGKGASSLENSASSIANFFRGIVNSAGASISGSFSKLFKFIPFKK